MARIEVHTDDAGKYTHTTLTVRYVFHKNGPENDVREALNQYDASSHETLEFNEAASEIIIHIVSSDSGDIIQ